MSEYKEGTYLATVNQAGVIKVGEKGTACAAVQYSYEDGETTKNITGRFFLTAAAVNNSIEKLYNSGFRGTSFSELSNPDKWVGATCEIVIKKRPHEGKDYFEVAFVNVPGSNKFAFLAPQEVRAELGNLDIALAAFAAKNGVKLGGEKDFSLED